MNTANGKDKTTDDSSSDTGSLAQNSTAERTGGPPTNQTLGGRLSKDKSEADPLFHVLKSLENGALPKASEAGAEKSSIPAIVQLLAKLRESELRRSSVSRKQYEAALSLFVQIAPMTSAEVDDIKRLIEKLHSELPPQQAAVFQNECLTLIRQFMFDPGKTLIVFITLTAPKPSGAMGNYHSYLTDKPTQFWHHNNGEPIGIPKGTSTFEGGLLLEPLPQNFRYLHFVN